MNESSRTATFVGVALVSVVLAWFLKPAVDITPDQLAKANLGQLFFPDFKDPNEPTSIRVITFDEARAASRPFAVEFKNGLWSIPSHHNYPADGKDRLAKTATSALGIKREELRSISKSDQEDLGVVDPLDEDSSRLKGRGQRITLSKGETVLADFIIGKQVRDRPGYYFVRVPTEDSTYVAKVDINLSTKFADWVETDLLKLSRDALREIVLDNYSISSDAGRPRVVKGEVSQLDRTGPTDPWKLEGLDEKTEELDKTKVDGLVGALDELKLVGVRPKPKGLRADLTLDRKFIQNELDLQVLVGDLRARGFEIGPDRDDPEQPRLYSRQGESNAATNDGVVYVLRFGEIFTGDEAEVEIGGAAGAKDKNAKEDGEGEKADDAKSLGKQSSRYLFVSTQFDEKLLGARPVEPERPAGLPEEPKKEEEEDDAKPEIKPGKAKAGGKKVEDCGPPGSPGIDDEEKDADEKSDADDDAAPKDDDAAPKADPAAGEKPADEAKPAGEAKPGEGEAAPKEGEKAKTVDELKKEYETLRQKYDADLRAWEGKVKAGREKVEELNQRFGEWYYVISAENFSKLHPSRKELVKPKEGTEAKGEAGAGKPGATEEKPEAGQATDDDAAASEKNDSDKAEEADKE